MNRLVAGALGFAGAVPPLAALLGDVGERIPGLSTFTDLAPPLVRPIVTLVTGGAAVAISVWGHSGARQPDGALPRRALASVAGSLVVLIAYAIALQSWTVTPPPGRPEAERTQIGFAMSEWSLTNHGRTQLADLAATEGIGPPTPRTLLEINGAYQDPERVKLIWKPLCVSAAGALLALLFFAGFFLWSWGFALIGRHLEDTRT